MASEHAGSLGRRGSPVGYGELTLDLAARQYYYSSTMLHRALHILIAEDDAATAKLYAAYATAHGHQVVVAGDGIEALRTAEAEMPDVVMLDIALPKLDGRDVCQRLKANPKTNRIPVLVVSAFGGDQYLRDELVDLGADDIAEKPIDLVIAFRKLERLVERAAPR